MAWGRKLETKVVPKFGKIRAVEIGFGGFVRPRQPISPATEQAPLKNYGN